MIVTRRPAIVLVSVSILLAACGPDPSGTPADAGPPDAPPLPPDADLSYCESLPPSPVTWRRLDHVPAAEDFTFDNDGFLVGVGFEDHALMKTPYTGTPQLVLPNVGNGAGGAWTRGSRFLPDGTLVVADPGTASLLRVNLMGGIETITSGIEEPNGIAIDYDGMVYLTTLGGLVLRIDPDTGASTTLVSSFSQRFDGITFGIDYRTLYFDEEDGRAVHKLTIDEDGTFTTPALVHMFPKEGFFDLLDGMAADECGNVYVVQMQGHIARINTDGTVERVVSVGGGGPGGSLISAINFGTGEGGWAEDKLYIMDLAGGVYEADVGVRGKPEPHQAR